MQLFVDQFADQLLAGLAPSYIVFYSFEQTNVGSGSLDEHSSVDFPEVQFSEDHSLLFSDISCASDSDDQQQFSNSIDIFLLAFEVQLFIFAILDRMMSTLSL